MITNVNFAIPISLQPYIVDFWHFKLWIIFDETVKVWNIKGLNHQVAEILGLENRLCDNCTTH